MRRGAPSGWFYWLGEWRPAFFGSTRTDPKIEKNENFRAPGRKTGHAVASRCYIR